MQVMNSGEFDQKNVLVGQNSASMGFGVSDDPMLMSMLSTGLYARPHRTMIQEIMFNAWDAHRMGNCQDRPIDIYITETGGLTVRDYGPGIAPEMIHPIYCIYGNSTKRDDKGQTGGFGLGSKSPFAYTDAFTVTSHHAGKKWMYLINRVSEENDGAPGLQPLLKDIPTEETGLVVTVPLKSGDNSRTYDYIKELLFLSGIKANIHYLDEKVELVESDSVAAGHYNLENHPMKGEEHGRLWAVYGGVRYEIVRDDFYSDEWDFVRKMAKNTDTTFYIGFAPDSLTPLPNREGLNLREKALENIKAQLEVIQETFQDAFLPILKEMSTAIFEQMASYNMPVNQLLYRWAQVGTRWDLNEVATRPTGEIFDEMLTKKQDDMPQGIWEAVVILCYRHTQKFLGLIREEDFCKFRAMVFLRKFPKYRKFYKYLLEGGNRVSDDLSLSAERITDLNQAKKTVERVLDLDLEIRMDPQGSSYNTWGVVSGVRGGQKKITKHKRGSMSWHTHERIKEQLALGKDLKLPDARKQHIDRLWSHQSGDEVDVWLLEKHIILAKTVKALNDTSFNWPQYFTPQDHSIAGFRERSWGGSGALWQEWKPHTSHGPIPAIVVKASNYAAVKAEFKKLGWKVIDAKEPEKRVKPQVQLELDDAGNPIPKVKQVPTFPVVKGRGAPHLVGHNPEMIEDPEAYFCATLSEIAVGWRSHFPRTSMPQILEKFPKTVVLHQRNRESVIKRMKVPHLQEVIDKEVDRLIADKDRMLKMYHHVEYGKDAINLPSEILDIPEMQKLFGIPWIHHSQKAPFTRDWNFLREISEDNWVFNITRKKAKDAILEIKRDPSLRLIREKARKADFFNKRELERLCAGKKKGEILMISQRIARFIRTI